MEPKISSYFVYLSVFSLMLILGCASESEIQKGAVNRYVQNGVYSNPLKGYQFDWPAGRIWKYRNYPEFDMSFDHFEGKAQLFVIGVKGLVRREYPDGFVEWLLNRLQAREISEVSHKTITAEMHDEFQIVLDCKFQVLPRGDFGVSRRVGMCTYRRGSVWLAVIYLSPEQDFARYQTAAEEIAGNIQFIE